MEPLITIIIPVYNDYKYLDRCVKSVLTQSYSNIEVILVDDGSLDGSSDLCDKFARSDERVVVIHQKNMGVSKARNAALDIMRGEFVTFIDGDDYVENEYIESLYDAIKSTKADISTCGHFRINIDGSVKKLYSDDENKPPVLMTGVESLADFFYGKTCSGSSGSKLYNKKLFENLRFPGYVMGEDTYVVYHTFSNADLIAHTNKALYYYVQHDTSVTNYKSNYYKFYDYVKLYDHIMSIDTRKDDKEYFKALVNRLIENNFWVYMKLRNCPDMYSCEKEHIVENIKKYRKYVIMNPLSEKRVRAASLLSFGGMRFLNFIYDTMNKF